MPFCPRCKCEYDVSVLVCPECHEVLGEQPDKAKGRAAISPDDSWVVVGGVDRGYETETARNSLDTHNIPSVLISPILHIPPTGLMVPHKIDGETGEARLIMVPREFQEEAIGLLRTVLGEDFGEDEMENH